MKKYQLLVYLCLSSFFLNASNHDLVGYWHNWNDVNAPYIQLDQVDSRYTVIELAFATPVSTTDMTMQFSPTMVSTPTLLTQIQTLQSLGKKVLISVGGATSTIDLSTTANKSAFITSMTAIINQYGLDGLDLDIESGASILASGSIVSPSATAQINLIDAVKQIMQTYRITYNKKLFLTMAPETAYVQGGMSAYGGIWGGYLPIIHALRDSLDILQVQLYNSGSMLGVDNNVYNSGTADFISAMTEAVIVGFNTSGGFFFGLPASKVAVGLPACTSAAGSGYIVPSVVKQAIDYIRGMGPNPGSYIMTSSLGYSDLRGMMTWSINWDAVSSCNGFYSYADNYQIIFGTPTAVEASAYNHITCYPNPFQNQLIVRNENETTTLHLFNYFGQEVSSYQLSKGTQTISTTHLPNGIYHLKTGSWNASFVKQ